MDETTQTSDSRIAGKSFADLREGLKAIPDGDEGGIRLIELLIAEAWKADVTDVHLAPQREGLSVACRRDGMLFRLAILPERLGHLAIGRLKVLCRLPAGDDSLPQDGRLAFPLKGESREIEARVAFYPVVHGQRVVLRLPERTVQTRLDALGYPKALSRTLGDLAHRSRDGLILLTGPSGSGKTTTLYALLAELTQCERAPNIMTIEDPVEREIDGITQTSLRAERSFDYPEAIRSVLRQDPDVLMLGEIRDPVSAKMSGRLALSGHLVLSTLHAGRSLMAANRLDELGLEPYVRDAVLRAVIAQRLVRRLCSDCASPSPIIPEDAPAGRTNFRIPVGCPTCHGTGYRGRLPVAELWLPPETIIPPPAASTSIDNGAALWPAGGLDDSALSLAAEGKISIQEWELAG